MAQVDIDAAALLVAVRRMCKLHGMQDTQSMATLADRTGVTASTQPFIDFANNVTNDGAQSQQAKVTHGHG
jgi:hypothetical protein